MPTVVEKLSNPDLFGLDKNYYLNKIECYLNYHYSKITSSPLSVKDKQALISQKDRALILWYDLNYADSPETQRKLVESYQSEENAFHPLKTLLSDPKANPLAPNLSLLRRLKLVFQPLDSRKSSLWGNSFKQIKKNVLEAFSVDMRLLTKFNDDAEIEYEMKAIVSNIVQFTQSLNNQDETKIEKLKEAVFTSIFHLKNPTHAYEWFVFLAKCRIDSDRILPLIKKEEFIQEWKYKDNRNKLEDFYRYLEISQYNPFGKLYKEISALFLILSKEGLFKAEIEAFLTNQYPSNATGKSAVSENILAKGNVAQIFPFNNLVFNLINNQLVKKSSAFTLVIDKDKSYYLTQIESYLSQSYENAYGSVFSRQGATGRSRALILWHDVYHASSKEEWKSCISKAINDSTDNEFSLKNFLIGKKNEIPSSPDIS